MKYVDSGNGKIPLISILAILSISLCINMPGLAVSPMLGKLRHIFGSTELEAQLLTSLPNLIMIPFVILAGRWATPKWSTLVLTVGLVIFFIAGLLSLWADSMVYLIVLGCLVGVGCALVVPIAAGYISDWVSGGPRQKYLGFKSTTSNFMVILANIFVGWVVVVNWHAAFAVYLVPIIPLLLVPFMTRRFIDRHRKLSPDAAAAQAKTKGPVADLTPDGDHFQGKASRRLLFSTITLYVGLTFCVSAISYYAPFMMEEYGMSTGKVGVVTACFYATVSLGGAIVAFMKKEVGKYLIIVSLGVAALLLVVMGIVRNFWVLLLCSLIIGLAYGLIQPIIYNKTTYIAPTRKKAMAYFGYVLSANYASIMLVPFVDSLAAKIFHTSYPGFEFIFSGVIMALMMAWSIWRRKSYAFQSLPGSPAPTPEQLEEAEGEVSSKTPAPN